VIDHLIDSSAYMKCTGYTSIFSCHSMSKDPFHDLMHILSNGSHTLTHRISISACKYNIIALS